MEQSVVDVLSVCRAAPHHAEGLKTLLGLPALVASPVVGISLLRARDLSPSESDEYREQRVRIRLGGARRVPCRQSNDPENNPGPPCLVQELLQRLRGAGESDCQSADSKAGKGQRGCPVLNLETEQPR